MHGPWRELPALTAAQVWRSQPTHSCTRSSPIESSTAGPGVTWGCWGTISLHGSALVLVYIVVGRGLEKVCDVVWPRGSPKVITQEALVKSFVERLCL